MQALVQFLMAIEESFVVTGDVRKDNRLFSPIMKRLPKFNPLQRQVLGSLLGEEAWVNRGQNDEAQAGEMPADKISILCQCAATHFVLLFNSRSASLSRSAWRPRLLRQRRPQQSLNRFTANFFFLATSARDFRAMSYCSFPKLMWTRRANLHWSFLDWKIWTGCCSLEQSGSGDWSSCLDQASSSPCCWTRPRSPAFWTLQLKAVLGDSHHEPLTVDNQKPYENANSSKQFIKQKHLGISSSNNLHSQRWSMIVKCSRPAYGPPFKMIHPK